jgi:hypothetical protein
MQRLRTFSPGRGISSPSVLEQIRAWIEARRIAVPRVNTAEVRQRLLASFVASHPSPSSWASDSRTVEAVVTVLNENVPAGPPETAADEPLSVGDGTVGVACRTLCLGQRLRGLFE